MKTKTMSWIANKKSEKEAYVTRNYFGSDDYGKAYIPFSVNENYGIRPMMTIKGSTLIKNGNGTLNKPYTFEETKTAKGGSDVNERYTGEYLKIDDRLYRIIETLKDGTTKVISESTISEGHSDLKCTANENSDTILYNPKDKTSSAYFINNKVSKYLNTSFFENHEIEVPIYKGQIIYGTEKEIKKYTVKVSAPNMYEMFSAQPQGYSNCNSHWLINSSKSPRTAGALTDIGVPENRKIERLEAYGIRVVGFLKKGTVIANGLGTENDPYIIK